LKRLFYKKKVLIFLIVISFVFFITLVYFSENWNKEQIIEKVVIENNKHINSEEILKLVNKELINKKKYDINLLKIEDIVEKHSFVEYCYVYITDNHTITISIKERLPIAFIKLVDNSSIYGDLSYIDKFGKIMPNRGIPEYSDMPILTGFDKKDFTNQNFINQIKNLLVSLADNDFVYNLISEISYQKGNKNFVFITTDKNLTILFGRLEDIEEKYSKFIIFWKEWVVKNNTNQIKHIDLRWKDKVVVV